MRKTFTALALLALLAALPASAELYSCTATMETEGICRAASTNVLCFDADLSNFIDLRDAVLAEYNYQSELVCASSRQFEPLLNGSASKILSAAGQAQGDCSTVGAVTANPQTSASFANAVIDAELRNRVIQWKLNLATEQSTDPTTIPTPDTSQ